MNLSVDSPLLSSLKRKRSSTSINPPQNPNETPKESVQDNDSNETAQGPVELVLATLSDEKRKILHQFAVLALKDYSTQQNRFFKIEKVLEEKLSDSENSYTLTFQAEDHNVGQPNFEATYEAEVSDTMFRGKVIHVRTITPYVRDWHPGKYCIPSKNEHKQILGSLECFAFMSETPVPKVMSDASVSKGGSTNLKIVDPRTEFMEELEMTKEMLKMSRNNDSQSDSGDYNEDNQTDSSDYSTDSDQEARREILSRCGGNNPLKLELDTLNDEERVKFDECASLALLDYNIQNVSDDDFQFDKIEEVISQRVHGNIYYITFQGMSNKHGATTFNARLFETAHYRMVKCIYKSISPDEDERFDGTFCIPKY